MKHWELTLACVPHLKTVLRAVERTQLDFYGSDRNFPEIEEALPAFFGEAQASQRTTWRFTQLQW